LSSVGNIKKAILLLMPKHWERWPRIVWQLLTSINLQLRRKETLLDQKSKDAKSV